MSSRPEAGDTDLQSGSDFNLAIALQGPWDPHSPNIIPRLHGLGRSNVQRRQITWILIPSGVLGSENIGMFKFVMCRCDNRTKLGMWREQ